MPVEPNSRCTAGTCFSLIESTRETNFHQFDSPFYFTPLNFYSRGGSCMPGEIWPSSPIIADQRFSFDIIGRPGAPSHACDCKEITVRVNEVNEMHSYNRLDIQSVACYLLTSITRHMSQTNRVMKWYHQTKWHQYKNPNRKVVGKSKHNIQVPQQYAKRQTGNLTFWAKTPAPFWRSLKSLGVFGYSKGSRPIIIICQPKSD